MVILSERKRGAEDNFFPINTSGLFAFFFFFFSLLAAPGGMWGLSSPTRDQTCIPCIGSMDSKPLDCQENP